MERRVAAAAIFLPLIWAWSFLLLYTSAEEPIKRIEALIGALMAFAVLLSNALALYIYRICREWGRRR